MSFPSIAIVGAGPAGLTLARILQINAVECVVFDPDETRSSRTQGGMLDLHEDSGQLALREACLFDEFEKHCRQDAEAMKLVKFDGRVVWDENDLTFQERYGKHLRNRPEIDRAVLRDILIDSLKPGVIQWNKKVVKLVESENNKHTLVFSDGDRKEFDIVIGADGAWSRVRSIITDEQPYYSGITVVEMRADDVSISRPWLSDFVGEGTLFMFDQGRFLSLQKNGNDSIRIYVGLRKPESWSTDSGIDWTDHESVRESLNLNYFADCHENFKRAIAESTDDLTLRKLYMLPVGFKWEAHHGVTLLGDAAHLMTPFAGVGVNVALTDAMCLAKALLKWNIELSRGQFEYIDMAIREYEEPMFERAKIYMEKTMVGLNLHFSADGIDQRVKHMRKVLDAREKSLFSNSPDKTSK
ncbi:FAD/NAD(P)-binding domain-containing protein [Dipodascopsis uninucleata]